MKGIDSEVPLGWRQHRRGNNDRGQQVDERAKGF